MFTQVFGVGTQSLKPSKQLAYKVPLFREVRNGRRSVRGVRTANRTEILLSGPPSHKAKPPCYVRITKLHASGPLRLAEWRRRGQVCRWKTDF